MLTINVQSDMDRAIRQLGITGAQMPFAVAKAITNTAQQVKVAEIATMRQVFDRPTPWTLNSVYVKPATKQSLTARVWLKDFAPKGTPAEKYLAPQIQGGQRNPKRVEALLKARGIMPSGDYAVPGQDMPLDAFGNLPKTHYNKLLSQLKAQNDSAQNESIASKKRRKARGRAGYFVGTIKATGQRAVFMGQGGNVKPVLLFARQAAYQVRFRYFDVAMDTVRRNIFANLAAAWELAKRTAR